MQNRFKSWALWLSALGGLWTALSAFGVTGRLGITESAFRTVLDAVGTILIAFGIVNNPTDGDNL